MVSPSGRAGSRYRPDKGWVLYMKGEGVLKDYVKADTWFRIAAAKGSTVTVAAPSYQPKAPPKDIEDHHPAGISGFGGL